MSDLSLSDWGIILLHLGSLLCSTFFFFYLSSLLHLVYESRKGKSTRNLCTLTKDLDTIAQNKDRSTKIHNVISQVYIVNTQGYRIDVVHTMWVFIHGSCVTIKVSLHYNL